MSRPTTPSGEELHTETMEADASAQEVVGATDETAAPAKGKEKAEKAKKAKAADPSAREPGKSVLPFSRVQRIMKADKDLVMVQREAAFLISLAAEQFIARFAEAVQRQAGKDQRTTLQLQDVAAVVRRAEEFAFLEELFAHTSSEVATKRKPKGGRGTAAGDKDKRDPTMLDQFVSKTAGSDDEGEDEDDGGGIGSGTIVTNEDGTLSIIPASASEPS